MNNDIIAIAREASRYADIEFQRTWESGEGCSWQEFRDERFAALARADEREACAKFFEDHWRETWTDEQVVEAIRART